MWIAFISKMMAERKYELPSHMRPVGMGRQVQNLCRRTGRVKEADNQSAGDADFEKGCRL